MLAKIIKNTFSKKKRLVAVSELHGFDQHFCLSKFSFLSMLRWTSNFKTAFKENQTNQQLSFIGKRLISICKEKQNALKSRRI